MKETYNSIEESKLRKRRRVSEALATFGLLLLAVGLVAPFANVGSENLQKWFKWIFAAGAVVYTVGRALPVNAPYDSIRLRRLRRLELWAGIIFCVAAFFWFYKAIRLGEFGFSLALIHDTILFTLAGAMIQIIASWMITSRMKKEDAERRSITSEGSDAASENGNN